MDPCFSPVGFFSLWFEDEKKTFEKRRWNNKSFDLYAHFQSQ